MIKKKIFLLLVGIMFLVVPQVLAVDFSDVSTEHWAYEAIAKTTELRITNGYPDGNFLPEKKVTRAEFSKMLVEALNLEKKSRHSFEDVNKEFWGYEYVKIASNYLAAKENENMLYYYPNDSAVREDIAEAVVKAMKLQNKNYNLKKLNDFSDYEEISEDKQKYILIASKNKLMIGNANGTFNPKGTLTRAEAAQLILNLLDYEKEKASKVSSNKRPSNNTENEKITFEYEWQEIEDSSIGQGKLYIKNSKGEYVDGTLKLTTLSGATIIENVTANGSENLYIKSAISSVEINEIF